MFESAIARWGYLAVVLGTLVEGEGTALAAGALAHKGLLTFSGVWAAAFLGTAAADQLWFHVGQRFGESYLERHPKLSVQSRRIEEFLSRYGSLFVVSLRFLYGLRTASVLWLGASGFPYRRFLWLDMLGAVLWSSAMGALGWGAGATLKHLLGRLSHTEELLIGALAVGLLVFGIKHVLKRRARAPVTSLRHPEKST